MTSEEYLKRAAEEGKYSSLYRFLISIKKAEWLVSFSEIERMLGFALPESARKHRQWRSNRWKERGCDHALTWKVAGWKTSAVDLERETLVFKRCGTLVVPVGSDGRPVNANTVADDLDVMFPPHDPGPWPTGLSLRREDLYDDRGR